jgi:hypothetical protein
MDCAKGLRERHRVYDHLAREVVLMYAIPPSGPEVPVAAAPVWVWGVVVSSASAVFAAVSACGSASAIDSTESDKASPSANKLVSKFCYASI